MNFNAVPIGLFIIAEPITENAWPIAFAATTTAWAALLSAGPTCLATQPKAFLKASPIASIVGRRK